MFLKTGILFVRGLGLEVKQLIFNLMKNVRVFGLGLLPSFKIFGKVGSFDMEGFSGRFLAASFSHLLIIISKEPPVFKTKGFNSPTTRRIQNSKNGSMVTFKHGKMVNHRIWKIRAPFSISKESIKTLISGIGIKTLVSPSVSRTIVTQINKARVLDQATKV